MKENGLMVKDMELALIFFQVVRNIKENGIKILKKEKAFYNMQVALYMKEIF